MCGQRNNKNASNLAQFVYLPPDNGRNRPTGPRRLNDDYSLAVASIIKYIISFKLQLQFFLYFICLLSDSFRKYDYDNKSVYMFFVLLFILFTFRFENTDRECKFHCPPFCPSVRLVFISKMIQVLHICEFSYFIYLQTIEEFDYNF